MIITTILASFVFLKVWRWPPPLVAVVVTPLLLLEGLFFGSNALKIPHGGWAPILMAAVAILLMWTWVRGASYVRAEARRNATSLNGLLETLGKSSRLQNTSGTAVFLTADPDMAPSALLHNLKHNHVLHERNLIIYVTTATQPFVAESERIAITKISDRFIRIDMCFDPWRRPTSPGLSAWRASREW
jgi:KUP system potassium uptake protein